MSDETRKDQRVKVQTLKAKYKSATVEEFIEQYAADISRGGIFIKTPKPPPNGTLLKIEIQLKDATPVISAVGRVVWRREQPEGAQAAGMGIKFVKVDESSQSVIDRIVAIKGEDAGPRFDSSPAPADTGIAAAGENTSEFFGTTNPSEEMPAPQDRTMMRQMSAFLGEALRGAVSNEPEPAKPAPSTATPGAAKPAAPAAATPASAGVPGGPSSAGRPGGMKPALPKATMVGLAPAGGSPLAAFAAEAAKAAAAAEAAAAPTPAPVAAPPAAPEPPAAPAKPVSAGVPGKGPVKPIGKGTMVGLAPPVPMPAPAAAPAPAPAPAPAAAPAPSSVPMPSEDTPARGIDVKKQFDVDDGGATAVADRDELNKLVRASEGEDVAPAATASAPIAPAPSAARAEAPAEKDLFDEPAPKPAPTPRSEPAPAPAATPAPTAAPAPAASNAPVAPPAAASPAPAASNAPVPAPSATPAVPAPAKPPVALYAIIGILVLALLGAVALFALKK